MVFGNIFNNHAQVIVVELSSSDSLFSFPPFKENMKNKKVKIDSLDNN
jgi:hypothetical protein